MFNDREYQKLKMVLSLASDTDVAVKDKPTQKEIILQHLKAYGSITHIEGIKRYNMLQIPAKIYMLKRDGHDIITIMEKSKTRFGHNNSYARYVLKK